MPLFYLKCALNQPKMVQNTWNLHQSSISVSTFRKYEQKFVPVKNLAAATREYFKEVSIETETIVATIENAQGL